MAREFFAAIAQQCRVTIQAEVHRLLGAQQRNKIAFRLEEDVSRLVPVKLSLEQSFGSVRPIRRPEDFAKLSRIAKEEKAKRTVRQMRQTGDSPT